MEPENYTSSYPAEMFDENLIRNEYIHSFLLASGDSEIAELAEEGLEDYLKILDEP